MTQSLNELTAAIIENVEDHLLVTQRMLQLSGVDRIFCYVSVAEAMRLLTDPVDMVLLDMELGDEDGAALLPQLRSDHRFGNAVFVALTANVLPQDVRKARDAGFDSFLGKPLNFERFPAQLAQILAGEPVWQTR